MTAVELRIQERIGTLINQAHELELARTRLADSSIVVPAVQGYSYPDNEDGWHVDVGAWGEETSHMSVSYSTNKTPVQVAKDIVKIRKGWLGTGKLTRRVNVYGSSTENTYQGRVETPNLTVDLTIRCALPETCTVEYVTEMKEVRRAVVTCA